MTKKYKLISQNDNSTVVEEYKKNNEKYSTYQSESELEKQFIELLKDQGYEYLNIKCEQELINNLRVQIEKLNKYSFSNEEWEWFFKHKLANENDGIKEKTKKIQDGDGQELLDIGKTLQDGSNFKNIKIIDKQNIHNNYLQVINQYEATGAHMNRYDVTILINGFPMVHIELKKRGINLKEAFNQINRYQRDSFWSNSGLYQYIQIFVISNGTLTKYYSNTTRSNHVKNIETNGRNSIKTSNTFEFTSWWADAKNKRIDDLTDFTKTFFAKHVILNIITKYCIFTQDEKLMVMRPYQIAAAEKILNKLEISNNYKYFGTKNSGGYIWHTTGSGKTLTSFKVARLMSNINYIDKVLFVVDRQDLDYQTMQEYDKFEKGSADSTKNTRQLERILSDEGLRNKIAITTIQKLNVFVNKYKNHQISNKKIVIIFDECHRSQFGAFHQNITRYFKNYFIFGFTGTPIFTSNLNSNNPLNLQTTEQAFGEQLHSYTIVDALQDENVLPFMVDHVNTIKSKEICDDSKTTGIKQEKALMDPKRISQIVEYILKNFNLKTKRNETYELKEKRLRSFNSIFCVDSINMAKLYYEEFKKQQQSNTDKLKIVTIFSFSPNEEDKNFTVEDEMDPSKLDTTSRVFLENAIKDYNQYFSTNFSTDGESFQNYYKDVSKNVKENKIDILIVVNMFLTGFDSTTLNTLWVDKNLKYHGLMQAFSRTNRILNTVKQYGNIVCFRNLENNINEAISLFGDKDAKGIVILKSFNEYYFQYSKQIDDFKREFQDKGLQELAGVGKEKEFIVSYSKILRLKNILNCFVEFKEKLILSEREFQDYQSLYLQLWEKWKNKSEYKTSDINDDVVFEIELVKQDEISINYILRLIEKYHGNNCQDKEITLNKINGYLISNPTLRSKKELIEEFIKQINIESNLKWQEFISKKMSEEFKYIIKQEELVPDKAIEYMKMCFRDGEVKEKGTYISNIMPKINPFSRERVCKKNQIVSKMHIFFDKYYDISEKNISL